MAYSRSVSVTSFGTGPNHSQVLHDTSNDYLYIVTGGNASGIVQCWRSTDDGDTWSELDSGNRPTVTDQVRHIDAVLNGSTIHVITQDTASAASNENYEYHAFSTSSNTWTTKNTSIATGNSVSSTEGVVGIRVRSSGDIVVFYNGATEKVHGTDYFRLYSCENTGGGFGTPVQFGTGNATDYITGSGIVLDAGGRVWMTYSKGAPSGHYATYLADGSSTLASEITVDGVAARAPYNQSWRFNTVHDHSGTDRKTLANRDTSNSRGYEIDGTGSPSAAEGINDASETVSWVGLCVDDVTDTVYAIIYKSNATTGMGHFEDSGSGWGTFVSHDNNTASLPLLSPSVIRRTGGEIVIAYIVSISGTMTYVEYQLAAGGASLTISDWSVGVTLDTFALTQVHNLLVNDWSIASTLDTFALTQVHNITVADWAVAITLDTIDGIPTVYNLTVQDLAVGVTLDTFALTQVHNITVQDLAVTVTLDTFALTQVHNITVQDLAVGVTLDNVVLATPATLVIQDWAVAVTLDTFALTQVHNITVQDWAIGVTLDNVVLTAEGSLTIQDWSVGVTLDTFALSQVHNITVADLAIGVTLDAVVLVYNSTLTVQDMSVTVTLDTFALTQQHNITVADWAVGVTLDSFALGQGVVNLVVQDWAVGVTLDNVVFWEAYEGSITLWIDQREHVEIYVEVLKQQDTLLDQRETVSLPPPK